MVEIVKSGGWLMAPIILCAIIAMGIILERFWTLQQKRVNNPDGAIKKLTAIAAAAWGITSMGLNLRVYHLLSFSSGLVWLGLM